jgi:signal transduction histidine kinase
VGISSAQKTVNADGQRLAQVVANLIDNALKFTPSGGAVTIEAQERESELEIRVSDSGIGLSQEAQASLFRPFAQVEEARALSPKGLGLGLFIAKSIVEAHGGRLEVASAGRHKGTVFSVFVPLEVEQVIGN